MTVRAVLTTIAHSNTVKGIIGGVIVAARVDYMAYRKAKDAGDVNAFYVTFKWGTARNRYLHGALAGGAAGVVTDLAAYLGIDANALIGLAQ